MTLNNKGYTPEFMDDMVRACMMKAKDQTPIHALIYLSDHSPSCESYLEVRPSRYGNGLFAMKDIPRNTFITMYPAHLVVEKPKKGPPKVYGFGKEDPSYLMSHKKTNLFHQGDPTHHNDLFYGHMINDSYPNVEDFKTKPLGEIAYQYNVIAETTNNAEFCSSDYWVYVRSTKTIHAGDEILVSYGPMYWSGKEPHEIDKALHSYLSRHSKKMERT